MEKSPPMNFKDIRDGFLSTLGLLPEDLIGIGKDIDPDVLNTPVTNPNSIRDLMIMNLCYTNYATYRYNQLGHVPGQNNPDFSTYFKTLLGEEQLPQLLQQWCQEQECLKSLLQSNPDVINKALPFYRLVLISS